MLFITVTIILKSLRLLKILLLLLINLELEYITKTFND